MPEKRDDIPAARHDRRTGLRRWVPGYGLLLDYSMDLFRQDAFAGLVLTALLAPVGMGYAEAAGLPAIYGLYATIVPLIMYAIFGPSRILVIGPDSALTALIAATVLPLAAGDTARAASLAAVLALLVGAICIVAGVARLGFVTDLLSKPIRYGYLNGIALTLLVGQLPKLMGFKTDGTSIMTAASGLFSGVMHGRMVWPAFLIGLASLLVIFACKVWAPKVPGVLLAVVGASIAVNLMNPVMASTISMVGALPQGLPAFHLSVINLNEFGILFTAALAIALVSITDMSVLSRIYALKGKYYVNENQELVALGIANMATGLFQGFPVSSSTSRTPVAEAAGARSQVTCLVGASGIALLLLFSPALMKSVPHSVLGAVVISACWTILEIREVRRLYLLSRGEFMISIVCFSGVAALGAVQGLFIAVGMALMLFVWRAWRPYCAVLGRIDGLKGYHDIKRHPEARRIPGLILFRWDAPLFFANAEFFREHILRAVSESPTPARLIVVAAEPVTDVDITAADLLAELDDELQQSGIDLCFAAMKGPTKDRLKQYGLFSKLGCDCFFPTIGKAVDYYVEKYDVEWLDWEERGTWAC